MLGEENRFSFFDRVLALAQRGSEAQAELKTPVAVLNRKKALGMVTAVPAVLAALSIAGVSFHPGIWLSGGADRVPDLAALRAGDDRAASWPLTRHDDPPGDEAGQTLRPGLDGRPHRCVIVAHSLTLWQFREMIRDQFDQIKNQRIDQLQADRAKQVAKVQTASQAAVWTRVLQRRADFEKRYHDSACCGGE